MLKEIWRFRLSTLPGGLISIFLIFLAFFIFFILIYTSYNNSISIAKLDNRILKLIEFTLYQAFLSTLFSILCGILLAWSLSHQTKFIGRSMLINIFSSSFVLPTLIVVFGIISIFGRNGYINRLSLYVFDYSFENYIYGLSGIFIAHVYLNASFAARTFLHVFEAIPKEKYKLAKSLDFSLAKRFMYVEFPALKNSIKSTSATIFLLCFTSFAIVLTIGGSPAYNTLEVAIYEAIKLDFDIPFAIKLAYIQLIITIFFVFLSSNFSSSFSNLKTNLSLISWNEKKSVTFLQQGIIFIFALFFIFPLIAIFIDGLNANFIKIFKDELFIKSLFTSIIIATFCAFVTVVFALLIGDTKRNFNLDYRFKKNKISIFLNFLLSFSGNLYLAIPSLILGLSFFLFSLNTNLGTNFWAIFALICANVLMSLPFALSVLVPLMQKIAQRYDKLIFSLDIGYLNRWIYIDLPYLRASIGYVFALSFCLSLGDLGVISLFGNRDIITLPWYLYQLMGSYKTHDAAGVALILLVITLSSFIFLPKIFTRSKHA